MSDTVNKIDPEDAAKAETNDPTERQEIRFRRRGDLAEIILTRPKALNALTLHMIRQSNAYMKAWAQNPAIKSVVISGIGGKAFCAGGDVRAVWDAGREGGELTHRFFAEEYQLNRKIQKFQKPFVALIDGITMGGGVGVSVHGAYRVAGNNTMVAMPETGIGFFPDVGTTHVLANMRGGLGMYLGLTGARLGPADAVYAGFATHYVPSERIMEIPDALVSIPENTAFDKAVEKALGRLAGDPGEAPLAAYQEAIDRCFRQGTVEDIVASLENEGTDWANETLKTLNRMSPISLKLTHAAIKRAAAQDFDTSLRMEFRLSQACMRGHDFYEGIRAVLVDKDKAPKWSPACLAEITDEMVNAAFEVPSCGDLQLE